MDIQFKKVEDTRTPFTKETQLYEKHIMGVDANGTKYIKRTMKVTRESLVEKKEALEAEIKAIDALK